MRKDIKFRNEVTPFFKRIKSDDKKNSLVIPICEKNHIIAQLRLVTADFTEKEVELLAKWRDASAKWFPSKFKVTKGGTRKWLIEKVIDVKDRILFWVQTLNGFQIGHMGLYRFDFKDRSCEIDNVIRGEKNIMPGIMTLGLRALLNWSFSVLKLRAVTLRVFSDNKRATALYQRCGFKKVRDIPLKKVIKRNTIQWVEMSDKSKKMTERYFSQFRITRARNNKINKI